MCLDAITPKSNAWFCLPVAQVHEKDGRWHHGGFRDHRAGEHRVLHAVVESDSLEVLVNLGSIDTVSCAPRIPAPPETFRSRALCPVASRDTSAADHLSCTGDRFSRFRRPAYVRTASFSLWKRSCSGARPAVSSSSSRARRPSMCLQLYVFRYAGVVIEFSMFSLPQWMPHGASCGFLLEHTILRLYMSLCSRDAFAVTDVVRI